MKYAYYVSGNATRLKSYLRDETTDKSMIAFVLIDNVDNSELSLLCESLGIPFHQYSYSLLGLKHKEQNTFISNKLLRLLDETGTDYCFVFGGRILVGQLLSKYHNKLINFHPALLPAYKGKAAIDQALHDHALLLGNTAHFINEELDSGTIIMHSLLPSVRFVDYDSVLDLQVPMLKQIIFWLENDRFVFENDKFYIKDAGYDMDTFIPNLERMA
ncbi:MAG: hypothetical protein LBT74_00005 [Acidobacteriota bacterium]|jgi:phosphoribosylglycinamide formyltransferase-1|nr:hypothetical protein [Acidobacteriota bacterium]